MFDICSHYQLLVHLVKEWSDTISDWNELGQDVYYICAQVPAVSEVPSMVFVIGDGKNYSGFINKALSSGQKYQIYSRGLTVIWKVYLTEFSIENNFKRLVHEQNKNLQKAD